MKRAPNEATKETAILLVHDVDDLRVAMKRALEAEGYRVGAAYDRTDAVERARSLPPELVLVELGVASLDALSVGVFIREQARLSDDVPLVIFAGGADASIGEGDEVSLGRNKYLILPEDFEQFRRFLVRVLPVNAHA